jgi:hypothetical protein
MARRWNLAVVGIATAFAAALLGAGFAPALASETGIQAECRLVVYVPTHSGGVATATGGRADCSTSVGWVEVKLMHVQAGPLPDTNMKTVKKENVVNGTWTASNPSTSGAVYRTLTRSSTGASYQSSTSTAP